MTLRTIVRPAPPDARRHALPDLRPVLASGDDLEAALSLLGRPMTPGQHEQWLGEVRLKGNPRLCAVCSGVLDPWLVDQGERTHVGCRPVGLEVSPYGIADGRTFALTATVGGMRLGCTDLARKARREALEGSARGDLDRFALELADRSERRAAAAEAFVDLDVLEDHDPSAPGYGQVEEEQLRAREVKNWSAKSRARMVETIAGLDMRPLVDHPEGCPVGMVTLTYPGDWLAVAPNGKAAKAHLIAFWKRFFRAFGWYPPALWKMEFQRRGAPHFHIYMPCPATAPDPFCAQHKPRSCRCGTFERWLSWTWADIVGAQGGEHARHVSAGTGVDFGVAARCSDPRRLAIYFLKHSAPGASGSKEYQHIVPLAWQAPGAGPGRFWGYRGLESTGRTVHLDVAQYITARRVLRRVYRARRRAALYSVARGQGMTVAQAVRLGTPPVRTMGSGGSIHGGFVLVNDGVALAHDLVRWLQSSP